MTPPWHATAFAHRRPLPARRAALAAPLLAALLLLVATGGALAGQTAAPEPLVVDGDPILALVSARLGDPALYAVGSGALYRSDDGGATWATAGPLPPPGRLVVAADDPRLLLAGDHPPCARGGESDILHRSEDGGATWQSVTGGEGVRPLALWAAAGVAVGAACDGLRLSADAGRTWQPTALDELSGSDVTAFAIVPSAGPLPTPGADGPTPLLGLIAATSEGGTSRLRSLDLSDPASPLLGPVLREFWGVGALAARDPNTLLLGAADGLWLSLDGGATWERRRAGLEAVTLDEDPAVGGIPPETPPDSFGIETVVLDPRQDGRLFLGTADGAYASDDAGATWRRLEGTAGRVTALALAADHLLLQTEDAVLLLPLAGQDG